MMVEIISRYHKKILGVIINYFSNSDSHVSETLTVARVINSNHDCHHLLFAP
jgi:hypothetical protein